MRQRRAELDPTEFLDETEQKTMIESMYNQNEWWNNTFRYILTGVAGILAAYKIYATLAQFASPFSHGAHMGYQATFSYSTIMFFEFISAGCYTSLALAAHPHIIRGFLRQWIHIFSLLICVPLFLITCLYRPDLWLDNILLFGGNIVVTIVSYYVNSSALATRRDIMSLKKHTYDYKKA